MQLIAQIPALNERETLVTAIGSIPRSVLGIPSVESLGIGDGSVDRMVEVAHVS